MKFIAKLTKANTTTVDPGHLKVKDTEFDQRSNQKLLHYYHHAKNQLNWSFHS